MPINDKMDRFKKMKKRGDMIFNQAENRTIIASSTESDSTKAELCLS
jgi:hypothetical protein